MHQGMRGLIVAALLAAGCAAGDAQRPSAASVPTPARPRLATVVIHGVPHVTQKPDFCGEADVAMFLRWRGIDATQDQVFDVSGMDPARGTGDTTRELGTALRALGVRPGRVWYSVRAHDAAGLDRRFAELYADLARGVPSIVCTRFDERPHTTEHFRLVLDYDAERDQVVYSDPAVDNGAYLRMSRARFLSLWPLKYDEDRWTIIRMALDAKELKAPPRSPGFSAADYAQHVMRLGAHLPRGFSVVVAPPFVIVGDGGEKAVAASAEHTVRWAVERLKRSYFSKDPSRILDIWLFKDGFRKNFPRPGRMRHATIDARLRQRARGGPASGARPRSGAPPRVPRRHGIDERRRDGGGPGRRAARPDVRGGRADQRARPARAPLERRTG